MWEAVLHGPAGFQKRVALKRLTTGTDALVREARLGGLLRHPNLVEVYALEKVDGDWVAAMELCTGGSLRNLLPLSPRAVVDVGLQAAAGLAHAHHEIGLVHLDLKPDNLLLHHGQVKVADLGVARAHGFGHDGSVRGTPAYMAPEHLRGDSVDRRADVYALGVVLLELSTGAPSARPSQAPWLREVLERCLAADPGDRYASMGELAAALETIDAPGATLAQMLGHAGAPRAPIREPSGFTFTVDLLAEPEPPTNLPSDQGVFVGRSVSERRLRDRIALPGLVTLLGAGGMGKTRLARRAARAWHDAEEAPAWFVDLAPARSAGDVVRSVAAVLEIPLAREADATQVGLALGGRGPLVLLLDNFEQVLGAAELVHTWREAAPQARFLVTSQAPLQVPGERIFRLEPLQPDEGADLLEALAEQRGIQVADRAVLREISERLDGLPLALELAAGRLAVLSPAGILERLTERFRLLRGGGRGAPERHATLRAALDWSFELLSPAERIAFTQCAVFAGAFDVPAAEAVVDAGAEEWALDLVEALLDRSLIHRRGDRLVLYESARAYAREKGDDPRAEIRHGEHYARLGTESSMQRLRTREAGTWRSVLVGAVDELVVAADRAIERGDASVATACTIAASAVFTLRGPLDVGLALVDRVLRVELADGERFRLELRAAALLHKSGRPALGMARVDPAIERAIAVGDRRSEADLRGYRGAYCLSLGDLEGSRRENEAAGRLYAELDHRYGLAETAYHLGLLESVAGRVDAARPHFERALEGSRELDCWPFEGQVLTQLGLLTHGRGQSAAALPLLTASLAIHREVGNGRMEAAVTGHLGLVHQDAGNLDEARGAFRSALRQARELGDPRLEAIFTATLGSLESCAGHPDHAVELFERGWTRLGELDNRRDQAVVEGLMGRHALRQGEDVRALELLEAAEPDCRMLSQSNGLIRGWLGEARVRAGQTERGMADLEAAIAALDRGSWIRNRIQVEAGRVRMLALLGRLDQARSELARVEQAARELGDGPGSPTWVDVQEARRAVA